MIPADRLATTGGFDAPQADPSPVHDPRAGPAADVTRIAPRGLDEFERSLAETSAAPQGVDTMPASAGARGQWMPNAATWLDTLEAATARAAFWLGRADEPPGRLALDWLACLACTLDSASVPNENADARPVADADWNATALRHLRPPLREGLQALATARGITLRSLAAAAWHVSAEQFARAEALVDRMGAMDSLLQLLTDDREAAAARVARPL